MARWRHAGGFSLEAARVAFLSNIPTKDFLDVEVK